MNDKSKRIPNVLPHCGFFRGISKSEEKRGRAIYSLPRRGLQELPDRLEMGNPMGNRLTCLIISLIQLNTCPIQLSHIAVSYRAPTKYRYREKRPPKPLLEEKRPKCNSIIPHKWKYTAPKFPQRDVLFPPILRILC